MRWYFRFTIATLIALLPSFIKVPIYRWFLGYQIGKGVRIGLSPLVGVRQCRIGNQVRIGSFNLFYRIDELEIGDHAQIGFLNLFRGGHKIDIGAYVTILRQNVCNAIVDPDFVEPAQPILVLGVGSVVTSGHWLDFSAGITIGAHSIIGGRNSSLWTHNRQVPRSITIGPHCYLGSEIRVAPGVVVAPYCLVALGAVLMGPYPESRSLIGGNPARVLRPLREDDLPLVCRKTRSDISNELAQADMPDELRTASEFGQSPKVEKQPADSSPE